MSEFRVLPGDEWEKINEPRSERTYSAVYTAVGRAINGEAARVRFYPEIVTNVKTGQRVAAAEIVMYTPRMVETVVLQFRKPWNRGDDGDYQMQEDFRKAIGEERKRIIERIANCFGIIVLDVYTQREFAFISEDF